MITAQSEARLPSADHDAVAVLHLPEGSESIVPETDGIYDDLRLANGWGRDRLIGLIRAEGVEPFITRGAGSYTEDVVRLQRPLLDGPTPRVEVINGQEISAIGVIHNVSESLDTTAPQLNDPVVRMLARDKAKTADVLARSGLHEGLIMAPASAVFDPAALDLVEGTMVFIKPQFGSRSEGVIGKVPKMKVRKALEDAKPADYVIEPLLNFAHRWPATIQGRDPKSQKLLEEANRSGANKEIRVYGFGNGEFYCIGRVAQFGETDFKADEWVYLDQQTIPSIVWAVAAEADAIITDETKVREKHLAIDLVFASSAASGGEPTWRVNEINAGEPELVGYHENVWVAHEQRKLLAGQLARIARKQTLA